MVTWVDSVYIPKFRERELTMANITADDDVNGFGNVK